ncbi:DUF4124 domain-containing protein [Nitrosomonas cryotolerans]|nr:DUF4124 domain-containing protein [Nitrosomonas cryotolerans]
MTYAHAEIYKHIDENGHITYSNTSIKDGEKLLVSPSSPTSNSKKTRISVNFPRVSTDTQKKRDSKRRKILENELAIETKLLADTQRMLSEIRNYPAFSETNINQSQYETIEYKKRIQTIKDKILAHERNVKALKKELAHL